LVIESGVKLLLYPYPNIARFEGGGVIEVSLTVVDEQVANIVPLMLSERIDTVNVSAPSVVKSATGVTVKVPAFDVIEKDPDADEKSAPAVVTLLTVQ
jgi:hypothetical protein